MSIQTEIDRIQQNVTNTYSALEALGCDMPEEQTSDNLFTTAGTSKVILYKEQELTEEQKSQARKNIDATSVYIGSGEMPDGYDIQIDPDGEILDVVTKEEFSQLLKNIDNYIIPDGVKQEASNLVDKAISREGKRLFRFLISADAHQKNDNEYITKGNIELGKAHSEILNLIGVDFIANLGDIAWAANTNTVEEVKEQIKSFHRLVSTHLKGENLLYLEGNHDDGNYSLDTYPDTLKLTSSAINTLIYSKNKNVVYDEEHVVDGYCYKDFEQLKVRVICLNTNQGTGDGGVIEGYQLKWFAEKALDMTNKTDWSVITLAHHPLNYPMSTLFKDCINILDAFINGENLSYTTSNGTSVTIDYTNKNCQYVGHFHGHAHAFSVVKMQKYVNNSYVDIDAYEICIPNSCYSRNNQYLGNANERFARYSTEITYDKENVDGKRTSFSLVTVCLDEKIIYIDNYGVGIDREVSYKGTTTIDYTNLVSISVASDGVTIYGIDYNEDGIADGYENGKYVSTDGVYSKDDSFVSTGYIKITLNNSIYIKGNELSSDNHTRLYGTTDLYGQENYVALWNCIAANESGTTSFNNWYTIEILGDKYYKLTPTQEAIDRVNLVGGGDTYYIRVSLPGTGKNLIITDGEPIE